MSARSRSTIAVVLALTAGAAPTTQAPLRRGEAVLPDATRVVLEIAASEADRQRGLMARTVLAPDSGMIFVFDEPDRHAFWMKNTFILLDILWLDAAGTIVWIAERLPPCTADPCPIYAPGAAGTYAIEVNAGVARQHRLAIGQRITLRGVPQL